MTNVLKNIFSEIFRGLLAVSFVLYIILFLLEWWQPGFVSLYFNSDIILGLTLISGLVYLNFPQIKNAP